MRSKAFSFDALCQRLFVSPSFVSVMASNAFCHVLVATPESLPGEISFGDMEVQVDTLTGKRTSLGPQNEDEATLSATCRAIPSLGNSPVPSSARSALYQSLPSLPFNIRSRTVGRRS
jgi:hypothetical protein